jgi:hypothetical protein
MLKEYLVLHRLYMDAFQDMSYIHCGHDTFLRYLKGNAEEEIESNTCSIARVDARTIKDRDSYAIQAVQINVYVSKWLQLS